MTVADMERRLGKRRIKDEVPVVEKRSGAERRRGRPAVWGGRLRRRVLLLAAAEERKIMSAAKAEGVSINSLLREVILAGMVATGRLRLGKLERGRS